jgi:hypothetical protein
MPRNPRIHTRPGALVEVVNRTMQGRFLIKPGPRMNAIIVGALAKCQQDHGLEVYGGVFMSNHFHLLLGSGTVEAQANFMRDFTRKLSIESGELYNWRGSTFPNRYHGTEISEEPEAQISRLDYCFRNGCKEDLVASPLDWPGVPFAEAMISGEPLQGIWIDRTAYRHARARGEDATLEDFTEPMELRIPPLPCHQHLDTSQQRSFVMDLVRQIEEETDARHQADGTAPIGAIAVVAADPHAKSATHEPSPQPLLHAFTKRVWKEMRQALSLILAAYREAADRLKNGDFAASFPENTFPPARPFVEPFWAMTSLVPEPQQTG